MLELINYFNCISCAAIPKKPQISDKEKTLMVLGFDESWITITKT